MQTLTIDDEVREFWEFVRAYDTDRKAVPRDAQYACLKRVIDVFDRFERDPNDVPAPLRDACGAAWERLRPNALKRFINRYNLNWLEDVVLFATGVVAFQSAVLAFREKSLTLSDALTILWAIILFAYGLGAVSSIGHGADEGSELILSFDA